MKLKPPVFDRALVEEIEAWLDQAYQTEIFQTDTMGPLDDGLMVTFARGAESASGPVGVRRPGNHARPMFQLIPDQAYSGTPTRPANPCPDCYDFSRSWNCEYHPERSYDTKTHAWGRPGQEPFSPPAAPAIDRMLEQFTLAVEEQAAQARRMWTTPMPVQPLIDRLSGEWTDIDRVPAELLPDNIVTYNAEVEITGETVQGDGITIRFQAVRRDR